MAAQNGVEEKIFKEIPKQIPKQIPNEIPKEMLWSSEKIGARAMPRSNGKTFPKKMIHRCHEASAVQASWSAFQA